MAKNKQIQKEFSEEELIEKKIKKVSRIAALERLTKERMYNEEYLPLYFFAVALQKHLIVRYENGIESCKKSFEIENKIHKLENKLDEKEIEIEELKNKIKELEKNNSAPEVPKIKNERGAGRKKVLTEEQIEQIKKLKLENKSLRKIAEEVGCSLGTVQRTLKNLDEI